MCPPGTFLHICLAEFKALTEACTIQPQKTRKLHRQINSFLNIPDGYLPPTKNKKHSKEESNLYYTWLFFRIKNSTVPLEKKK